MPWKETCPMSERRAFVEAWMSGRFTFVELCERFSISTKTGYKWVGRFREQGIAGLEERSRAPHHHPNQTPARLVERVLQTKARFPTWGPVTIVAYLQREHPRERWPAPSICPGSRA